MKGEWTCLHFACANGQMKVASLLLEHGADVVAKDWVRVLECLCFKRITKDLIVFCISVKNGKWPFDLISKQIDKAAIKVL